MENELTIGNKNMVSLMTENPLGDLIKPLSHEILLFDTYIAGVTHIDDESVLDEIIEGKELILRREPDNCLDENAILVLNEHKQKLGYIPEKDNIVFARLMDAGKLLTAKVKYYRPTGIFKEVGITIYLEDF